MANPVIWPSTLPGPSNIVLEPAERRHVSSIIDNGIQQVSGKQTDYLADESVRFEFTAAQAIVFQSLWITDLVYGGAWFGAQWPCAHYPTGYGVRRFKGEPSWRLIGHEYWEVTCKFQLRGRIRGPGGSDAVPAAGGTRLYDLRMVFGNGSQTTGSYRAPNPFTFEQNFSFGFSIVSHNTANLVPPGAEIRMTLSASRTYLSDPAIAIPVYEDFISSSVRSASWVNGNNIQTFPFVNNVGGGLSHLYTDFIFVSRAYVDGVDVGQGVSFTSVPDRLYPTGGGGTTGYPTQYLYNDHTWGVTA